MKNNFFVIVFLLSINLIFCDENKYFFYVPTTEETQVYFSMKKYLSEWDSGNRQVDDFTFDKMYQNNIGGETINSLLLESFFRNTSNIGIQQQLKKYIIANNIETSFSKAILKKIDSEIIKQIQSDKEVTRFMYRNEEYDENINLFDFREVSLFNKKFGVLLFENDWNQFSFNSKEQTNENKFFLIYGGGTNSVTINFYEKKDITKKELDMAMNQEFYKNRYPDSWQSMELDKNGVLWNCGADNYIIAFGNGPDTIPEIDSATFNAYLYNEKEKKLYAMSTSMNFSKINIFYSERYRIFNYLLFNTLFCFIE
jgi:hypothetical protein